MIPYLWSIPTPTRKYLTEDKYIEQPSKGVIGKGSVDAWLNL